ncbi:MAG: hypothetical protein EBU90_20425 [Proteobacteria bacterium]|nr:hypothetical protein [Pseudomonadota bacterium]
MNRQDLKLINEAYNGKYDVIYVSVDAPVTTTHLQVMYGRAPYGEDRVPIKMIYDWYDPGMGPNEQLDNIASHWIEKCIKLGKPITPQQWLVEVKNLLSEFPGSYAYVPSNVVSKAYQTVQKIKYPKGKWYLMMDNDLNDEYELVGIVPSKEHTAAQVSLNKHIGSEDILGVKDIFKDL